MKKDYRVYPKPNESITLYKGEAVCLKCKGAGLIKWRGLDFFPCTKCGGPGKMDWIKNITKPEYISTTIISYHISISLANFIMYGINDQTDLREINNLMNYYVKTETILSYKIFTRKNMNFINLHIIDLGNYKETLSIKKGGSF